MSSAAPYRGQDRRVVRTSVETSPRQARALVLLLGALALLVVLLVEVFSEGSRSTALDDSLDLARAVLFSGAGVLCLVRWQATGLTRPAFVGAALLVLGVLAELLPRLLTLVQGVPSTSFSNGLSSAAAAVAAALLIFWARRAPAVDAATRPGRLLLVVCLTVPVAAVLAVLVAGSLAPPDPVAPVVALTVPLAAMWGALSVAEHKAGLDLRSSWLAPMAAALAVSSATQAVAALAVSGEGTASLVGVVAAVIALRGSAFDLRLSLSAQNQDLLRLSVDVHDSRELYSTNRAQQEERLHEVRNVLAGLHGATATLRKYEDRLDPGVRRRLEDAVSGELHRLAHLIDPAAETPLEDVALAAALDAVVAAEREVGADLEVALDVHRVRARGADLATVVSVLLVNARRHAPGSAVRLCASRLGDEVQLSVSDRGSGVALDRREAIFERGERAGASVPGQGLGLYVARRLVGEMGGTLGVDARPGGGAQFVLTLAAGSQA